MLENDSWTQTGQKWSKLMNMHEKGGQGLEYYSGRIIKGASNMKSKRDGKRM